MNDKFANTCTDGWWVTCKKIPNEGTFKLDKKYWARKLENTKGVYFIVLDDWEKEYKFINWKGLNKYFIY